MDRAHSGWRMDGRAVTSSASETDPRRTPPSSALTRAAGITELRTPGVGPPQGFALAARDLGVVWMHRSGTDFPGSIYPTLALPAERTGGFVADTGDALAVWVSEFLDGDRRRDVRNKLARSEAHERHAFLILPALATAEFGVVDLLMRDGAPLPNEAPALPNEVTHVWAMSTWSSGQGMRWSPTDGWSFFDKRRSSAA